MRIESLRLKNFRMFQDIHIKELPGFCVFVGANGSGKTTLFDVFGFLRDCLKSNVRQALQVRGGFKEVISRGHESEEICITVQFRLRIAGKSRLVTYDLVINQRDGKPNVKHEALRYKRGSYGRPYNFLRFENGTGFAITNEEDFDKSDEDLDREYQELESSDILALKGLGQFQRFKAASTFRQLIENWHLSDFHINSARGSKDAGHAEHLSPEGENLPLVSQYIFENHPKTFKTILMKMNQRVPGVEDVKAQETEDGRLVLKFHDGSFKDPFVDRYVSDGTIKMFAYLVLLYDPKPHPLLCVEEPENQLYPRLLEELAEEFRMYAYRGGQVMVSTHSPDFLNAARPEEVFWITKEHGYSKVHRASDHEQVKAYFDVGEKLGLLWKEGLFEGAGQQ